MPYQIIYSSESTMPMQADDLAELLEHARTKNGIQGISGALIYADGLFLQILEGDSAKVDSLMTRIRTDPRHEKLTVLREGEIPAARFSSWNMAYVSATPEQVARWAGIDVAGNTDAAGREPSEDLRRTEQFAQDILALLSPDTSSTSVSGVGSGGR